MILPRYQTYVYRKYGFLSLIHYAVMHPWTCQQWIPTIDTILARKGIVPWTYAHVKGDTHG